MYSGRGKRPPKSSMPSSAQMRMKSSMRMHRYMTDLSDLTRVTRMTRRFSHWRASLSTRMIRKVRSTDTGKKGGMLAPAKTPPMSMPTSPMETMTTTRSKVLNESILKTFQPSPMSLTALSKVKMTVRSALRNQSV